MPDYPALIGLLADGEFHSGEAIGQCLGISRAAVWKQLPKLMDFGLGYESIKGCGYRLTSALELLDKDQLLAAIDTKSRDQISRLECLFELDSTNEWMQQQYRAGLAKKGCVCLAEFQRQGRGRRGRQWLSPLGSNIILSLLWEFEGGVTALEGLSLSIGIAVVRALVKIGVHAQLKWPNDILVDDKKLGGVLLEMLGDPAGVCQVVIGIGLNVHMQHNESLEQPWTSVAEYRQGVSRNHFAALLVSELFSLLQAYLSSGFSALSEEWLAYDAYLGRTVKLLMGKQELCGIVRGVASNGALRLEVDGVETDVHAGEISLRLASP